MTVKQLINKLKEFPEDMPVSAWEFIMLSKQEYDCVLDRIREISDKLKELELLVDNLGYYISDDYDDYEKESEEE